MDIKQPFKVDIVTKSKTETLSLYISIIAIVVSLITFVWNFYDIKDQRKQDRNDFFAINSSYIDVQFEDSSFYLTGWQGGVQYQNQDSILDLVSSAIFHNTSKFRCDILGWFFICNDSAKYLLNEFLIKENSDSSIYNNYFVGEGNLTILPENKTYDDFNVLAMKHISLYDLYSFVVLYKNALGGMYSIQYNFLIEGDSTTNLSKSKFLPFWYKAKGLTTNFKIYNVDEIDILERKLKTLRKEYYKQNDIRFEKVDVYKQMYPNGVREFGKFTVNSLKQYGNTIGRPE